MKGGKKKKTQRVHEIEKDQQIPHGRTRAARSLFYSEAP